MWVVASRKKFVPCMRVIRAAPCSCLAEVEIRVCVSKRNMDRKMRSAFYSFGLLSCVDCSVQGVVIRGLW